MIQQKVEPLVQTRSTIAVMAAESASGGSTSSSVNQLLADEVTRVLRERGWSLQGAEIATSIPASTINRMSKGLRVKAQTIVDFGRTVGEDAEKWAHIALGLLVEKQPEESPTPNNSQPEEITYELDPDYLPAPEGYHDLDDAARQFVSDSMRAAVEYALRRQREGAIGNRYVHEDKGSKGSKGGITGGKEGKEPNRRGKADTGEHEPVDDDSGADA